MGKCMTEPCWRLVLSECFLVMLSPPNGVAECIMFWGCPSTAFVHPDRSCFHDLMNGLSNLNETQGITISPY